MSDGFSRSLWVTWHHDNAVAATRGRVNFLRKETWLTKQRHLVRMLSPQSSSLRPFGPLDDSTDLFTYSITEAALPYPT